MQGTLFLLLLFFSSANTEYSYVAEPDKEFVTRLGEFMYLGCINVDGTFVPTPHKPPIPVMEYIHRGSLTNLNSAIQGRRDVYELRSGRLVPGRIGESGHFVPQIGGKIIAFSEYRFSIFARPIYNLPGFWLKKGDEIPGNDPRPKISTSKK